jgi:hypothetical protein
MRWQGESGIENQNNCNYNHNGNANDDNTKIRIKGIADNDGKEEEEKGLHDALAFENDADCDGGYGSKNWRFPTANAAFDIATCATIEDHPTTSYLSSIFVICYYPLILPVESYMLAGDTQLSVLEGQTHCSR